MPSVPLSVQQGVSNCSVTPSVLVTEDLLTERLNLMREELRREFDDKLEKLSGLNAWVPLEFDACSGPTQISKSKAGVHFQEDTAKPVPPLATAHTEFANGIEVKNKRNPTGKTAKFSAEKTSYITSPTEADLSKWNPLARTGELSIGSIDKFALHRYLPRAETYSSRNVDEIEVEDAHLDCLAPTVWESTIFIGLPQVGLGGSFLLFILLLCNIGIQLIFSLIIANTFPSEPINIESMQRWRHFIGHHYSQVDTFGHSLVGRVCEGVETLTVAQGQREILDSARVYSGISNDGPVLCSMVILLWVLVWLQEAERVVKIAREIWLVPAASRTRVALCRDRWSLENLSRCRKFFTYLVCVARMAVALALLLRGTFWLVYTVSITELVLNAVALQFIFDIDELIYNIFTPKVVKTMLERLVVHVYASPLKGEAFRSLAGLAHIFAVCLLMFGVVFFFIHPNSVHVQDVVRASCGGKRNFAIGRHADLGILFYTRTRSPSKPFDTQEFGWEAIDEIIESDKERLSGDHTIAAFIPDFDEFSKIMAKDASEVADDLMSTCSDSMPSDLPTYWRELRRELNMPDATSCEDLKKECGHPDMHLVRLVCPGTCRCYYSTPSIAISKGCPYWRCQDNPATAGYYDSTLSCDDAEVSSLIENPNWQSYWRSKLASKVGRRIPGKKSTTGFEEVAAFALKHGCAVIKEYDLHAEVCAELKDHHSLGTYCPVACDCPNNTYWGCPSHCYEGGGDD